MKTLMLATMTSLGLLLSGCGAKNVNYSCNCTVNVAGETSTLLLPYCGADDDQVARQWAENQCQAATQGGCQCFCVNLKTECTTPTPVGTGGTGSSSGSSGGTT